MAENETLNPDARTANRWYPLMARLDHGESPSDMFQDFEIEFYRSLRRVYKRWEDRGVDPAELFDAALNDPRALRDLIKKTRFCDYAKLLKDVVAVEPALGRDQLLGNWLNAVWESVRSLLQLDRHEASPADDFGDQVNQMLARLLCHLTENPSRIPPRPPRPPKDEPPDIDAFLHQSLL